MELYFSQHFEIDPDDLTRFGAFDISIVSDLPLFIDPFLLFNIVLFSYFQEATGGGMKCLPRQLFSFGDLLLPATLPYIGG